MLGKIKHLYQIGDFHPLSQQALLKFKDSPPCESLGSGFNSKINNNDMGERGKANLLFLRNQGFLSKIPEIFCSGLSEKLKIFREQMLLRLELYLISTYLTNMKLVKTL